MIEPRLYIVMREDLWDMNPGKGMAQAAHAQAMFDDYVSKYANDLYMKEVDLDPDFIDKIRDWRGGRGFGVTTVLSAPLGDFDNISMGVEHNDFVEDPTYPYRNYYKQMFTRSEVTCMWAFVTRYEELDHMKQWKLHP